MYKVNLDCPVIRRATSLDAEGIAEVILNSNSSFIAGVFRDSKRAKGALTDTYMNNFAGLYVLTEGTEIIGVMRLQLPQHPLYAAISFSTLVKNMGWIQGIRAGLLLSPWDEYVAKKKEAYLEFLYIHRDWNHTDASQIMLNKAVELATATGAKFLSIFIPEGEEDREELFELRGFFVHKKISSPIAKLFRAVNRWNKWVLPTIDRPITVKGLLLSKVELARQTWRRRRNEAITSLRYISGLLMIPLIYGTLAYTRGFAAASAGWAVVLVIHLSGLLMLIRVKPGGVVLLTAAVVLESGNLFLRAARSTSWEYRLWITPLSLINLWMIWVIVQAKKENFLDSINIFSSTESSY